MDWAYRLPERGENHLIEGCIRAHRAYKKFGLEYPSSLLADYLFFFGYSGLVLSQLFERIAVDWDCLFHLGLHDGDLGFLAGHRQTELRVSRRSVAGIFIQCCGRPRVASKVLPLVNVPRRSRLACHRLSSIFPPQRFLEVEAFG